MFDFFVKQFGQLPCLYDGDQPIVQSGAILRHLARKHSMWPSVLFLFHLMHKKVLLIVKSGCLFLVIWRLQKDDWLTLMLL